jgi:hypothetical protein
MHSPAVSYTIPCLLLLLSPSQEVLHSGQGWSQRDGESGQLLVDRGRHLDTLEWSFMINSFSNKLYYKWVATGHWALGSCSCCQCCKGTPVLICKFFAFAATYVCRTAEATTLWLQQVRSRPASAWFGRANVECLLPAALLPAGTSMVTRTPLRWPLHWRARRMSTLRCSCRQVGGPAASATARTALPAAAVAWCRQRCAWYVISSQRHMGTAGTALRCCLCMLPGHL